MMRTGKCLWAVIVTLLSSPAFASGPPPSPLPPPPGPALIRQDQREALADKLRRAVFRAEASQTPPEPYRATPMRYDGAVVAVRLDDDSVGLLTSAAWLVGAEEVTLISKGRRVPLVIERVDHRHDLALLRLPELTTFKVEPIERAQEMVDLVYCLLSPGDPYEQFVDARVFERGKKENAYFWITGLSASNGYPLLNSKGELVAIQTRRLKLAPPRGLAIGRSEIEAFLDPEPHVEVEQVGEVLTK